MGDFNKTLLKLILIALTAPLWWPFLKAVWQEFNQALAEDGGLFGPIPGHREQDAIERERRERGDPLLSEPKLGRGETSFRSGKRGEDRERGPAGPATPDRRAAHRRPRFRG